MMPTPTARRERRGTPEGIADWAVYQRHFRAPIAAVWAAVTEPERLQRWVGTYVWSSGGPGMAGSTVAFRMTAEGEDAPEQTFTVHECRPPERLAVSSVTTEQPDMVWRLELDLAEHDGITTLTFAQPFDDTDIAASVGPGWEYYLDRLVAAETGDDVTAISWPDYEQQAESFRRLFG